MYKFLLELHSGFRYIVFILVIVALVQAFSGWLGDRNYTKNNKRINLFAMISAHTQFLFGLILYFVSPFVQLNNMGSAMKDDTTRYWTVEHIVMMLFAIVLITIGHSRSKKAESNQEKHRSIAIFYSLAFIVIVVAIVLSKRPLIGMPSA
ncbi:cytochrome B [Pedobacter sp. HMF7647]|uniref:Cytochrome B n=1 Tax=Hufsiella arboris TaxID=2695275 RepID=A0A7K1YAG9_9SPHI|nr:cytochrome B [Hufsiella arboris]MXV51575.1 cytochrome B [Hufsiella arboris]